MGTTSGKILIHIGDTRRYIYPEELSSYEQEGWSRGSGRHPVAWNKGVPSPYKGVKKSEETRKKMSEALKKRWKRPEYRKLVTERSLGPKNPQYGKSPAPGKGLWYDRLDDTKVWLRSSYEVSMASILDRCHVDWLYECKRFTLREGYTVCPDFYLPAYDLFIEVKSGFTWSVGGNRDYKQLKEMNPDIIFYIVMEEQFKLLDSVTEGDDMVKIIKESQEMISYEL